MIRLLATLAARFETALKGRGLVAALVLTGMGCSFDPTGYVVIDAGGKARDAVVGDAQDQDATRVDAVGGEIEIICDGGVRRGTHVLKSLCSGASAASGGRLYLYALAAAGEEGVERALAILTDEIERGMRLMGVTSVDQLTSDRLRVRPVS